MYEKSWILAAAFGAATLVALGLPEARAGAQGAHAPAAAAASAPHATHAQRVKQLRERSCKSMYGDEKKNCEKEAATDARRAAHRAHPAASAASGGPV